MYSAFVTSATHYAHVGYRPTSTILPHLLQRSRAAAEKTIKPLSIRGELRFHFRADPRSTCTEPGFADAFESSPEMHLREALVGPNDPKILPRDRRSTCHAACSRTPPEQLQRRLINYQLSGYSLTTSICLSIT